jgi:hypothetical protein
MPRDLDVAITGRLISACPEIGRVSDGATVSGSGRDGRVDLTSSKVEARSSTSERIRGSGSERRAATASAFSTDVGDSISERTGEAGFLSDDV